MENRAIEIRALIIAEIAGTLSKDEQRQLQQWIDEYPEVRALADHLREVLNYEQSISIEAMKEEFKQIIKIAEESSTLQKRKKMRIITVLSSAAAAMVALWFFTVHSFRPDGKSAVPDSKQITMTFNNEHHPLQGSLLQMHGDGRGTTDDSGNTVFDMPRSLKTSISVKVPAGKTYNLKLEDGTTVSLNSASEVLLPASFGNTREITINGEATLKVADDSKRPFIVVLNNMRIQVLGTEFNVNTYNPAKPEVALYSGRLRLTSGKNDVVLNKRSKATLNGHDLKIDSLDAREPSWSADTIVLSNADEKEIIQAFARYFDQQIVFDKEFKGKTLLTLCRNLPVKTLLEQFPGDYTIYDEGNIIHLKPVEKK